MRKLSFPTPPNPMLRRIGLPGVQSNFEENRLYKEFHKFQFKISTPPLNLLVFQKSYLPPDRSAVDTTEMLHWHPIKSCATIFHLSDTEDGEQKENMF